MLSPALAVDKASAVLKDKDGKEVGKVELTDTPSGVLMRLHLDGVPPGDHAFHVHAVGKCEPPDFKSAGPHFNPDETKHGLMNPEGPHAGDMPNLHVPDRGKLTVEVLNEMVTLDAEQALLDDDGSAIVVHADRRRLQDRPCRQCRRPHRLRRGHGVAPRSHRRGKPMPPYRARVGSHEIPVKVRATAKTARKANGSIAPDGVGSL